MLKDRFYSYSSRINIQNFIVCLIISALIYSSKLILLSLNADDVIQIQPISLASHTFLNQGRWGYYFIFKILLEDNPFGIFDNILGIFFIVLSSYFGAVFIGLKKKLSVIIFIMLSSVSIFYGYLFSYDSSRLAYPLGILLAISGMLAFSRGHRVMGFVGLVMAPAFYPVASEVAAVLLLGRTIVDLTCEQIGQVLKRFAIWSILLLASMVFYLLLTDALSVIFDFEIETRIKVSIFEALKSYNRLLVLGWTYSNPLNFAADIGYIRQYLRILMAATFLFFIIAILKRTIANRWLARMGLILIFLTLLMVAPFSLAFASPLDEFSARSMVAVASVYAIFLSVAVEHFMEGDWIPRAMVDAGVILMGLIVFENALAISRMAADEYLSYQEDIFITNRIIYRIEEVMADAGISSGGPIPLVVQYTTPYMTGARHQFTTARYNIWSREYIFRLIDHRFQPIMRDDERAPYLREIGTRGHWPTKDSVFVTGGTVVVIIN